MKKLIILTNIRNKSLLSLYLSFGFIGLYHTVIPILLNHFELTSILKVFLGITYIQAFSSGIDLGISHFMRLLGAKKFNYINKFNLYICIVFWSISVSFLSLLLYNFLGFDKIISNFYLFLLNLFFVFRFSLINYFIGSGNQYDFAKYNLLGTFTRFSTLLFTLWLIPEYSIKIFILMLLFEVFFVFRSINNLLEYSNIENPKMGLSFIADAINSLINTIILFADKLYILSSINDDFMVAYLLFNNIFLYMPKAIQPLFFHTLSNRLSNLNFIPKYYNVNKIYLLFIYLLLLSVLILFLLNMKFNFFQNISIVILFTHFYISSLTRIYYANSLASNQSSLIIIASLSSLASYGFLYYFMIDIVNIFILSASLMLISNLVFILLLNVLQKNH